MNDRTTAVVRPDRTPADILGFAQGFSERAAQDLADALFNLREVMGDHLQNPNAVKRLDAEYLDADTFEAAAQRLTRALRRRHQTDDVVRAVKATIKASNGPDVQTLRRFVASYEEGDCTDQRLTAAQRAWKALTGEDVQAGIHLFDRARTWLLGAS